MMRTPTVISKLAGRIGAYEVTKNGQEFLFNCPNCSDKSRHLSVNPFKKHSGGSVGVYKCWLEGSGGSLTNLCARLGIFLDLTGDVDLSRFDSVVESFMRGDVELESKSRVDYDLTFGEDWYYPISAETAAWNYLVNQRRIHPDDIRHYTIGIGLNRYRGRIILPEIEDDKMVYWQARSYTERNPKYLGPPGQKDGHVWNLANVRALYSSVVIAEGIFSAMACGRNGVALYSYNFLPGQVDALVSADFDEYITAFDGSLDAYENANRLACELNMKGVAAENIKMIFLPSGLDPADLGLAYMKNEITNAAMWNPSLVYGGLDLCRIVQTAVN